MAFFPRLLHSKPSSPASHLHNPSHHHYLSRLFLHQNPSPPPPHKPNNSSNAILPLIKRCSTKAQLLQLHAHLLLTSLLQHPFLSSLLLSRAATLHSLPYSLALFRHIPSHNVYHCNALLKAYAQTPSDTAAFQFYNLMRCGGIPPNNFSSSFVLAACTKTRSLERGRQLHARILGDGYRSDSRLLTSVMDLYASCGECLDARKLFEEMPRRDIVAWNVLISCYARNSRSVDALKVFDAMLPEDGSSGSEPDDVTCLLLLQACSQVGAVEFGERIHGYVEDRGYGSTLKVRNSLIAMYSKCGCVDRAYRVFCDTPGRNVVTWSAMISGLAMNGYGRDAIEAFREMQSTGVAPDEQTFTGVLSACSHSGLVDEGIGFFDMMRDVYRLVPNVRHYGCMVDLLGRAGLLDRAYEMIVNEMGVKPDATIWRTLLGACRIHKHVHLGERAIGHLIELKAQEAGDYVLLLNIYATAGDWEKVSDVRRLMKDKGFQTTPGCSTIELNGKVHEFIVDDDSHPRKAEIYDMLDEIGGQLKIAGYVAYMASELHDLDTEEKESALTYHSEKLAIAFGILSTPPGSTIRIAKNLRICVDCHTFAKVLSSVYNRLVIIRDRSRFHHFQEGRCSCNDYW